MEASWFSEDARLQVELNDDNRSGWSTSSERGTMHPYGPPPTGELGQRRKMLGRCERLRPLTQGS